MSAHMSPTEAHKVKQEYFKILNTFSKEQDIQRFIEQNTPLIPRVFVQNHDIHFQLVIRKLPLGNQFVSDFIFLSKSSADWNLVLIEIERPDKPYFNKNTDKLSNDFTSAIQQIHDWKAWLGDADNKKYLVKQLKPILLPMGGNPVNVKYVLVYGRRHEYDSKPDRARKAKSFEDSDTKVLSFDSLAEEIQHKRKLYLGKLQGNVIEIMSNEFVSEQMFAWARPQDFRIPEQLKNNALRERNAINAYRHDDNDKIVNAIDYFVNKTFTT